MFEALYNSSWYAPGLFWLSGILFLIFITRRLGFLYAYLVLFTVEILADALVTGGLSPFTGSQWYGSLAILFVILGDFRIFLLIERYTQRQARWRRVATLSAAQCFLVPLITQAARSLTPALRENPRHTFLFYEASFAAFAALLRFVVLPHRLASAPEGVRRWLLGVMTFVFAQYVGWALADIAILTGHGWGHGVRLIPNTMYYAGFLPFVYATAPEELRR